MPDSRDLRVHTCALNARDLDALAHQAFRSAPCFCDGEWVGEGPAAFREALEKEFPRDSESFARLGLVDGQPAIVEFGAKGETLATLRFVGDATGRIRELRIDHDSKRVVSAFVPEPAA